MDTTTASTTTASRTTEQDPSPVPATMRAVVARRYGTPEVVAVEEVPTPSPAAGEVLVQVEASSLNALDWHYLTGKPYFMRFISGFRRPKRLTPGADVAGTIVAVGTGVAGLAHGDRVFGQCDGGACAPFAVVKAANVVPVPDGVSARAAAATPVAGLTALQGLRTHGRVQPGDKVLVNGAAGGVGTFAVQLAVALGADVTAVCSTANVAMVRGLGAAEVVDYTTTDIVAGGARFDVMIDNVGNRSAADCLRLLHRGGRYVAISGPKENRWLGPLPQLAWKAIRLWRSGVSFHQFTESPNRDDLAFLAELLAAGAVVPAIQREIGLDDVAAALAEIGTGHTRAKIVVHPA